MSSIRPYSTEIIEMTPHPHAAKLNICQVKTPKENLQIVCGAKNARRGLRTILAPLGSKLSNGKVIEEVELRGEKSYGMLCSPLDLGISQESGLIDLPPETELLKSFDEIDPDILSSSPWYSYQLVESFWQDPLSKSIEVLRGEQTEAVQNKELLSRTYFFNNRYFYRKSM